MEQSGYITTEELFGKASRLALDGGLTDLCDISSLGIGYQLSIATLAILFIIVIVNYADAILYLLLSSISSRVRRANSHSFTAEIRNIESYTTFIGVVAIALMAMRFTIANPILQNIIPNTHINIWGVGGIVLGAVVALMATQRLLLVIVSVVCERPDIEKGLWRIKLVNFSCTMLLTTPLMILVLLTDNLTTEIALYSAFVICAASIILFLKETFFFFRTQRISIFHWILYLCTLEILPLSLIVAPIARGWV